MAVHIRLPAYFTTTIPSCCGVTLKHGTIWLAEICGTIGLMLLVLSCVSLVGIAEHYGIRADNFLKPYFCIPIIFGILQFVVSIVLAYGAIKEKAVYLLPWLWVFSVQTALIFLASVVGALFISVLLGPLPVGMTIFTFGTIYCGVMRYCVLVVYSYYRQLVLCPAVSTSHVVNLV